MNLEKIAPQELSPTEKAIYDRDIQELAEAEKAHAIDLKSRMQFGLDPAAMMTISEIKPLTAKVAEGFDKDADLHKVWGLIDELHKTGPWDRAEQLKAAEDPLIQTYLVLAAATREKTSKSGLSPAEYLADRRRVIAELSQFTPKHLPEAIDNLFSRIQDVEIITKEINGKEIKIMAASGDPALPAAMKGLHGVVAKGGENRFAQTKEIKDEQLQHLGLHPGFVEAFDANKQAFARFPLEQAPKGGRMIWVKQEDLNKPIDEMVPVAKRIGKGFVLTYKDQDLAANLIAQVENTAKPSTIHV